jgi:hypothetical protein
MSRELTTGVGGGEIRDHGRSSARGRRNRIQVNHSGSISRIIQRAEGICQEGDVGGGRSGVSEVRESRGVKVSGDMG